MSLKYSELDYLNETRIPPTYSCPTGYTLIDKFCELIPNMSCPPTYTLNNGICMKTSSNTVPIMESTSNNVPIVESTSNTVPMTSNNCPSGFERGADQMCYPIA